MIKKFLKKIYWKTLVKSYLSKEAMKFPLFGYPLVIYLEFEGQDDFVNNNWRGFQKIWQDKINSIQSSFLNAMKPLPEMGTPEWFQHFEDWSNEIEQKEKENRQKEINKCEEILKQYGYE